MLPDTKRTPGALPTSKSLSGPKPYSGVYPSNVLSVMDLRPVT